MARPASPIRPGATAVVTGAAGGLGRALTTALGARGCVVVATDAPGVAPELRALDVTDAAACRGLAEEVGPALWINNAGVLGAGEAVSVDDAIVQRVVDVNLLGVINGTRAAASTMVSSGGGCVLNIGSLSAWNPTPGMAVYAATKHAVRAYSAAVATELRGSGVRVACLCPDAIWTPMLKHVVTLDAAAVPFSAGRLLEADDVAKAALRLVDGGGLLASLPPARAVLAKVSGLWPSMNVRMAGLTERQGRQHQARYRRRLLSEDGGRPEHPDGGSAAQGEDRQERGEDRQRQGEDPQERGEEGAP